MYSLKPGRGPSLAGVVVGVVVFVFGIIWTSAALSMGAPPFFVLFGIVFVLMAIGGVIYNFYNATQKNRMSTFDVTTGTEEVDPIAKAFGHGPQTSSDRPDQAQSRNGRPRKFEGDFCPFCGAKAKPDFDYCPKCGKDI